MYIKGRGYISAATPTLSNHVKLDKWNGAKPIQKNRRIFSCFHYIQIMSSWMCVFSFLWWSLWFMLIIKWLSGRVSRSQTISLLAFVASLVSLCALLFFVIRWNVKMFHVFWWMSRIRIHTPANKNCMFHVMCSHPFCSTTICADFACEYGFFGIRFE